MTLLNRLQDTRAWLVETKGAKHVSPKMTLAELDRVIGVLQQIENRVHDPMMPPGTRRTREEIDKFLAEVLCNNQKGMHKPLHNCAQFDTIHSVEDATTNKEREA